MLTSIASATMEAGRGDRLEVPDETAAAWIERGIAKPVHDAHQQPAIETAVKVQPETAVRRGGPNGKKRA